jgi:hypothetical protein
MIIGTFGCKCHYYSRGEFYVRSISSLTGKQVKKDKRFRNTMKSAGQLAQASQIASAIYKELPWTIRELPLFRTLTGKAKLLLKEGKTVDEAFEILRNIPATEL